MLRFLMWAFLRFSADLGVYQHESPPCFGRSGFSYVLGQCSNCSPFFAAWSLIMPSFTLLAISQISLSRGQWTQLLDDEVLLQCKYA